MKLIFLYGPPATGKLTVAKEIAKLNDFKILHNHLFNDLVETILPYGNQDFFDLVYKLRSDLVRAAVKKNISGIITTYCYAHPEDDDELKTNLDMMQKLGVEIIYIFLTADKAQLIKRVEEESRRQFGKLKDAQKLSKVLDKHDFFTAIPFVKSLKIDNTKLSAPKVAKKIINYIENSPIM